MLNTCVSAEFLPRGGALRNGYFPEFNSRLFSSTKDTGGDDLIAAVTGGDVLNIERDTPVVVWVIYRTQFYAVSLDSGAQHDAFV